ncbi:MAG: 5'-nucleosidase, partial [Muribaculaceae bacterium]|nr:5'-nucleosidase [Muribaculaceae bacterium]
MKIGVIVAMGKELRLLLPLLTAPRTEERGGFTFHIGSMGAHEVIAMQCGIGKVNAALGTLTLLREFEPG